MILVTGATGFIGKALVRHLTEAGYPVRLLIRPARQNPDLIKGVPVEVTVSNLMDARSLRSAMLDVDIVYHLAGVEWHGAHASLMDVDIQGTQVVSRIAADLGGKRFFFVPEDGSTLLQPVWVEDLVTCLSWAMDNDLTVNQTYSVGGPEYLSFNHIVQSVLEQIELKRRLVHVFPPYLRAATVLFESLFPGLPVSVYWLDYLAYNRTCSLDTLPRVFNILTSRFDHRLDHLTQTNWQTSLLRTIFR